MEKVPEADIEKASKLLKLSKDDLMLAIDMLKSLKEKLKKVDKYWKNGIPKKD